MTRGPLIVTLAQCVFKLCEQLRSMGQSAGRRCRCPIYLISGSQPLCERHPSINTMPGFSPALRRVDRSSTVGFCPHTGLMAAGTVAGAIDMSFSTTSILDVSAPVESGFPPFTTYFEVVPAVPLSMAYIMEDSGSTVVGGRDQDLCAPSQVFALDFTSSSETLPLVGSVQAPERFNRLAWGPKLPDSPYTVCGGDTLQPGRHVHLL